MLSPITSSNVIAFNTELETMQTIIDAALNGELSAEKHYRRLDRGLPEE
jgi:hypothetical protein